MLRRGTTGTSRQSDRLSGFYGIAALDEVLEVMAVKSFQSVGAAYDNQVSIRIIGFGHTHYAVESSTNRIIRASLDICARMSPTSSVGRDYFTSGQWKGIFMFLQRIQMQVKMIAFSK